MSSSCPIDFYDNCRAIVFFKFYLSLQFITFGLLFPTLLGHGTGRSILVPLSNVLSSVSSEYGISGGSD